MRVRAALALAALTLAAPPLPGQDAPRAEPLRVSSAVAPETVTVGDRFRSVLQVVAPPGATVEFSPVPVEDALQPVDSLRVIPGRAGEPPIASYSLVAWVVETPLRAQVPVRVARADGTAATYLVPLRLPVVRSVLPADTAAQRPRPARGALSLTRDPATWWWPWIVAALLVLAGGAWLLLRRRTARAPEEGDARERAARTLEGLAREWASGTIDEARLYLAASQAMRAYLEALDPQWGRDLTSRELLERLAGEAMEEGGRSALARLLELADRVKFARHAPPPRETAAFLADARDWVLAHPPAAAPAAREAA